MELKNQYPAIYDIRHEIIKIYSAQNKIDKAINELENYLILMPNHPEASEILKYLKERL